MPEQWIIQVQGKEYGPASVETLREWKSDGRVLPTNPARRADVDSWTTAGEIPGLFDAEVAVSTAMPAQPQAVRQFRSLGQILGETFRIYRKGFFKFFFLTLIVNVPWICAQLSAAAANTTTAHPDLTGSLAALFALSMWLLGLAAWPVFIGGIQILTAELASGKRPRISEIFPELIRLWPRVAILCIFVYCVFALLIGFLLFIFAMIVAGASSPFVILLALGLLVLQIWMFSWFFINVLFWQQFAVLADCSVGAALSQSKELARGRRDLAWYRRPLWRGAFIVSLWIAFLIVLYIGPEWALIKQYSNFFWQLPGAANPQAVLQSMRESMEAQGSNPVAFSLGLLQTLLRPLLGISFVLLYLDSSQDVDASQLR